MDRFLRTLPSLSPYVRFQNYGYWVTFPAAEHQRRLAGAKLYC